MNIYARPSLSSRIDELLAMRERVRVVPRVGVWIDRGGFGGMMVSEERERAVHRSCIGGRIYTRNTDVRPLFGEDGGLVDSEVCERVCGVRGICEGSGMAYVLDALWRAWQGLVTYVQRLWVRLCAPEHVEW